MRHALATVVLLAAAGTARAQPAQPAPADDGEIKPTLVHARLSGNVVNLAARFGFDIDGPTFDEANRLVTIPAGAVVVDATATVGGKSHRLLLDEVAPAKKAFDELAERDPGNHRAWAVHVSSSAGSIEIDLAAGAEGHIDVELVLEMPSCFYRDSRYVLVPATWYSHLDSARTRVREPELATACNAATDDDSHDEWLAFPAGELARKHSGESRVGVVAGRLRLASEDLARIELDVSAKLTDVPGDLYTAIVIDHSRSLTSDDIETQRALVASYVQHVPPQSRVQIIAYARDATPLLPSWLPAAAAAPRIDREIRALAPRNGSNVDVAVAEASTWLSSVSGTRRLIIIGDDLFPNHVDADAMRPGLPKGTLVHVVDLSIGSTGLMRMTDDLALSALAKETEGISVGAGLDDQKQIDATMLVHPLGLDHITVSGPGWKPFDVTTNCPVEDLLAEGHTCEWWGTGEAVAGPIAIEAFIWGHRIQRFVRAEPLVGIHLARELTTMSSIGDDGLKAEIDRAALAVNDVWSMFASWGGKGGYSDLSGPDGFGTSGTCCGDIGIGTASHTIGFGSVVRLDLQAQLAPAIAQCQARDATVELSIETTREEIVGVEITMSPNDPAKKHCITEAVWDTSLMLPIQPVHTTSRVTFKP